MRRLWWKIAALIGLPVLLWVLVARQNASRPRTLTLDAPGARVGSGASVAAAPTLSTARLALDSSRFTLASSPDSQTLLVGIRPGSAQDFLPPNKFQFWNLSLLQLKHTSPDPGKNFVAATLSADGKWMAYASNSTEVKLWNVGAGDVEKTRFKSQSLPKGLRTAAVAISPNSEILAQSYDNFEPPYTGNVVLWNARTGQIRHRFSTGGNTIRTFFFSPDSQILIGNGGYAIQVWNTKTGALLYKIPDSYGLYIAFSKDGQTLATMGKDQSLLLWNVKTGALNRKITAQKDQVSAFDFAPDGKTLAIVSNRRLALGGGLKDYTRSGGAVTLRNTGTGALTYRLTNGDEPVQLAVFSPDGQKLAVATASQTNLWSVESGQKLRVFKGHSQPVIALAFTPDGSTLASGSADGKVILWRLR